MRVATSLSEDILGDSGPVFSESINWLAFSSLVQSHFSSDTSIAGRCSVVVSRVRFELVYSCS